MMAEESAGVQTSVKSRCPPGLDMSAHILTSGYWPSYPVLEAKLPAELTQYQVNFFDDIILTVFLPA